MSVHLVLYMYDCRSPLPGASIWCYICTTVGVHYQERPSGYICTVGVHYQERPSDICTTVGVHYHERPSGAIYVPVGVHYHERPSGAIYVRL